MTLTTQLQTMLAMIGMGSFLGAALDTYRYFFKRNDKMQWVVFLNDLIFWILQGLIIFYVLLNVNKGELRLYIFLALLCGFALYQSMLQTFYIKSLYFFISIFRTVYRFIVTAIKAIIVKPILLLLQFLLMVVKSLSNFLWNFIKWTSQIFFNLCKILLAPFILVVKFIWRRFPNSFQLFVKKFLIKLAGIFQSLKKLSFRIYQFLYKWLLRK